MQCRGLHVLAILLLIISRSHLATANELSKVHTSNVHGFGDLVNSTASILGASRVARVESTASCAPHHGLNCEGTNLLKENPVVDSAAACCALCIQTKNCTAWTWNGPHPDNGRCYPKLDCKSPKPDGHFIVSGGNVPAPPNPAIQAPGVLNVTAFGVDNIWHSRCH